MESKFKIGDVVTLKSGSPKMVISNVTYMPPIERPLNSPDNIAYHGYYNYTFSYHNPITGRIDYFNCNNPDILVPAKD